MSQALADRLNDVVSGKDPVDLIRTVLAEEPGTATVTTNFRPYEAVILHMATQVQPEMTILWIDHGANLPETYRFAEASREQLKLNVHASLPKMTAEHWKAIHGGQFPAPDQVELVEDFSRVMKLEPFQRGMKEVAPKVWITALRKEQNPQRAATLKPVMWDDNFQCLKVNPILDWTPAELDAYVAEHNLPNEMTYYDPAKGDEKHECGLHAKLTTDK